MVLFVCSGCNFWKPWPRNFIFDMHYAVTPSEYLGQGRVSRSSNKDQGYVSITKYRWSVFDWRTMLFWSVFAELNVLYVNCSISLYETLRLHNLNYKHYFYSCDLCDVWNQTCISFKNGKKCILGLRLLKARQVSRGRTVVQRRSHSSSWKRVWKSWRYACYCSHNSMCLPHWWSMPKQFSISEYFVHHVIECCF